MNEISFDSWVLGSEGLTSFKVYVFFVWETNLKICDYDVLSWFLADIGIINDLFGYISPGDGKGEMFRVLAADV